MKKYLQEETRLKMKKFFYNTKLSSYPQILLNKQRRSIKYVFLIFVLENYENIKWIETTFVMDGRGD